MRERIKSWTNVLVFCSVMPFSQVAPLRNLWVTLSVVVFIFGINQFFSISAWVLIRVFVSDLYA